MKGNQNQTAVSQNKKGWSWLRIVIIVLAILLACSAGALAVQCIRMNMIASKQSTTTIENNLVGNPMNVSADTSDCKDGRIAPLDASRSLAAVELTNQTNGAASASFVNAKAAAQKAEVLKLYQGHPSINQKFEVKNMLPGDTITKYFSIQANHKRDLTLYFNTEITSEKKNLGDVLHVVVRHLETDQVLCDAPFSEINGQDFAEILKVNAQNKTIATYQIDVSVSTSVGNEYQGAGLTADFNWYVKDDGGLTPPDTNDNPILVIVLVVFLLAAAGLIILLLVKRKKGGDKHDKV